MYIYSYVCIYIYTSVFSVTAHGAVISLCLCRVNSSLRAPAIYSTTAYTTAINTGSGACIGGPNPPDQNAWVWKPWVGHCKRWGGCMTVALLVRVVSLLAASPPSSLLVSYCLFLFLFSLFLLLSLPFSLFFRPLCLASVRPVLLCAVCLFRLPCLVACLSRSWTG